jgi:cysteine desulfurase/selenocysteine lyase
MRNIRDDFPILSQEINGKPLVYLDSAATSMRPKQVLEAVDGFYRQVGANPHRGLYALGEQATAAYESARETASKFIGARPEETIFTRGATESLNIVAYCYAPTVLKPGTSVVIPISEHHSNLVPWQRAVRAAGAELRYLYTDENGELSDDEIEKKIDKTTKIVAFSHVSNVFGGMFPVQRLVARARQVGAAAVLDCAQSAPHLALNLCGLEVDFAAFSGHKLYAPMGIGVLYGKRELLEAMPPFLAGGDMIEYVEEQTSTYAPLPQKFEAGTQNAGGAVGLAAAMRYIESIGWEDIRTHEQALMRRTVSGLSAVPHVTVLGNPNPDAERYGVAAFNIDGVHSHDAATLLDGDGVAIRAGHHCAQPLMKYLGIGSSCRASLGIYNTEQDIDALLESIPKVRRILGYGN